MFTHTEFEVSYPFEELKHIQTPRETNGQILLVYTFCCDDVSSSTEDDDALLPLESVAKTFRSVSCEVGNEMKKLLLVSLSLFSFAPIVARVENMKRIQSLVTQFAAPAEGWESHYSYFYYIRRCGVISNTPHLDVAKVRVMLLLPWYRALPKHSWPCKSLVPKITLLVAAPLVR